MRGFVLVGGWLVNKAYNHHVLWAPDEEPVRKRHRKRHAMK